MTTPTGVLPRSQSDQSAIPPTTLRATRPFYWSVRREIWENRSIYVAPLAAAAVVLIGVLIGAKQQPYSEHLAAVDKVGQTVVLGKMLEVAAIVILVTGLIAAAFYCLGALHGERRDRTILFWKSLPVSDLTTVLAKAAIPLLVMPLVLFVIVLATQLLMLGLATIVLLLNGLSAAGPWTQLPLFQMPVVLLYTLAAFVLWYAPIWGWLLFVSGWARRATFLWAVLPPLAFCVIEAIAFHTSRLADLLKYRFVGVIAEAFHRAARPEDVIGLAQLDPAKFVSSPALWIGLAIGAALCTAAVWLRRYRVPI
ncbi:MAG: type transport system permease protein [Aliidongia sp.]|nr:type transport system permease protein [Aliidongia sp.]